MRSVPVTRLVAGIVDILYRSDTYLCTSRNVYYGSRVSGTTEQMRSYWRCLGEVGCRRTLREAACYLNWPRSRYSRNALPAAEIGILTSTLYAKIPKKLRNRESRKRGKLRGRTRKPGSTSGCRFRPKRVVFGKVILFTLGGRSSQIKLKSTCEAMLLSLLTAWRS